MIGGGHFELVPNGTNARRQAIDDRMGPASAAVLKSEHPPESGHSCPLHPKHLTATSMIGGGHFEPVPNGTSARRQTIDDRMRPASAAVLKSEHPPESGHSCPLHPKHLAAARMIGGGHFEPVPNGSNARRQATGDWMKPASAAVLKSEHPPEGGHSCPLQPKHLAAARMIGGGHFEPVPNGSNARRQATNDWMRPASAAVLKSEHPPESGHSCPLHPKHLTATSMIGGGHFEPVPNGTSARRQTIDDRMGRERCGAQE